MRIAIGGLHVENGNFSPLPTTLDDFEIYQGTDLLESGRYPFLHEFDAEFLPTLIGRTWPGGEIEPAAYKKLKEELLSALRQTLPLDGVYLDLHGAMKVAGMEDAEADLASAIRKVVGPETLISASMDLHGNITEAYTNQIDMLTAYRTAPHADTEETRQRAIQILIDALSSGNRPHIVSMPIPIILPGEMTRTDVEPGRSLWSTLSSKSQQPGIVDASLFVGFCWVDEPRAHAAAVVSGTDSERMWATAEELAQAYWDSRFDFGYGTPIGSIDETIDMALAASESTVFISDAGDNPTAGAPGDLPIFAERLITRQVASAVIAAIPDRESLELCWAAGVGNPITLNLGGKLDPNHGGSVKISGSVAGLFPDVDVAGRQAILETNGTTVIITERRKPFTQVADFELVGIDPLAFKIVVVKLGYLFPDLIRIAPKALMALSPGASDLDLARLGHQQVERPIYPLDPEMAWEVPSRE